MHESPLLPLMVEDLRYMQAERNDVCLVLEVYVRPLDANPIGNVINCPHLKNLNRVPIVRSERRRVACIALSYRLRSLDNVPPWAEKGGGIFGRCDG